MRKSFFAAGFALMLLAPIIRAAPASAASSEKVRTYQGKVSSIIDGDSIKLSGIGREVRLIGVDAPESGECYYPQSKKFAQDELRGKGGRAADRQPREGNRPGSFVRVRQC